MAVTQQVFYVCSLVLNIYSKTIHRVDIVDEVLALDDFNELD